MFTESDLVFTRDKNNEYMGGGYVLKSELMEGGAPPIINVKDVNEPKKNKKTGGGDSSVSSLLFGGTRAVPAGLFLINRHQSDAQSQSQSLSSIYDNSRVKTVLGRGGSSESGSGSSSDSGSDSSSDSGSSSDDNNTDGGRNKSGGNRNAVVPETLYDALFKMLSPDADKRRYWGNGAKTQRQQQQQQQQQPAKKNNTRKKNKINE
jgi:hypothetical protein